MHIVSNLNIIIQICVRTGGQTVTLGNGKFFIGSESMVVVIGLWFQASKER